MAGKCVLYAGDKPNSFTDDASFCSNELEQSSVTFSLLLPSLFRRLQPFDFHLLKRLLLGLEQTATLPLITIIIICHSTHCRDGAGRFWRLFKRNTWCRTVIKCTLFKEQIIFINPTTILSSIIFIQRKSTY